MSTCLGPWSDRWQMWRVGPPGDGISSLSSFARTAATHADHNLVEEGERRNRPPLRALLVEQVLVVEQEQVLGAKRGERRVSPANSGSRRRRGLGPPPQGD